MAIITPPTTPSFKESQFGLEFNTDIFESPLTRQQQVLERSGARWIGTFTLPSMKRSQAADWLAWLTALKGQANTFYGYDPDARNPRGSNAQVSASNNYTRNGNATGGTVGTIGSGGAYPTNWGDYINTTGITREVQAINQTVNGIPCFRIRISGTAAATGSLMLFAEGGVNTTPAVLNDVFTHSIYAGIYAGSLSNITKVASQITENLSGGGFSSEGQGSDYKAALTSDLSATRLIYTRTLQGASTAFCRGALFVAFTGGVPIDITLLVGASQNEEAPNATPYIASTSGVSSRNAGIRVFGSNQSGTSVVVRGFAANQSGLLLAGDYVEIEGRLYMLSTDVATDFKGHATLQLAPALRSAPINDALLTSVNTKCEMRLVDDNQASWDTNENSIFTLTFQAVEVIQ